MGRFDQKVLLLTGPGSGISSFGRLDTLCDNAGVIAYSASKSAVHAFTRALAVEYADRSVRANSICSASIQTGMSEGVRLPKGANFELLNRLSSLQGDASPEAVADLVVFLASEDAKCISGEEIRIDGAALA